MIDVYLASPHATENEVCRGHREIAVAQCAAHLMCKFPHWTIFSPISYGISVKLFMECEKTHAQWLQFDLAFLRQSRRLWVLQLPGWEQSKGVKQEMDAASLRGLNITYLNPATNGVQSQTLLECEAWQS